jgi:CII-binding regulator of phage lambda lysogenization HflD
MAQEAAGSVVVDIGGNIAPFEAALAKAKQMADAFDAEVSKKLSGNGQSDAAMAKIAAAVEQTNAMLAKMTTAGTAASAVMSKVATTTNATTAALSTVASASATANAALGVIGTSGGRLAATGAGVLTLTTGMRALGATAGLFNPLALGVLALSTAADVAVNAIGSLGGGVSLANAALESHRQLISEITAAYPEAAASAKRYEDQLKNMPKSVAAADISKQIVSDVTAMNGVLDDLERKLAAPLAAGGRTNFAGVGLEAAREFAGFAKDLEDGTLTAIRFQDELGKARLDPKLSIAAHALVGELQAAANQAAEFQKHLNEASSIKSIAVDGQKTLADLAAGFKNVSGKAGDATAIIAKLFGTLNSGASERFGVTRSLGDSIQSAVGGFQQVDQAIQNARQNQLAGMVELDNQFRTTTKNVEELKNAIATAGGKQNVDAFFGDQANIKGVNAEIANAVTTVNKLFDAMDHGNASVNAVFQGLDMVRQTLIQDGLGVDAVNRFVNSLITAHRELDAGTGAAHQLGAALNALQDKTITITVQTRQVGSGVQSSYSVPSTYGGAEGAGTGSSYGVGGSSNVNVTRFSSTDRQVSQTPIFNTSTNSWGYTQPTTYQDPRVLAQVAAMYPARAAGGPISAGMPYWVGERGPELVTPSASATVIPNAQSMALANAQSGFTGTVATRETDRMWQVQMNIEANTRKTSQLLDEIHTSSGSSGFGGSSSSTGGGSSGSSSETDQLRKQYAQVLATWKSNFNAAGIVGAGVAGYGMQGLNATPEQIAHRVVYGMDTGGMIAPGDTQKVEFFKNPNERVIVATPQQFADVRPGAAGGSMGGGSDNRPIAVQQYITVPGGGTVSKDSLAALGRQAEQSTRAALRSVYGR